MPDETFDKMKKEIDQMNEPFSMGDAETDSPGTDAPSTEAPDDTTDAPSTDVPSAETEVPETTAPKTDVPTTDAPDDRDQIISDLRTKLNEKDVTTKAPTTKAPLVFEDQDFLKDLDLEDVTRDPKEFNKLLNSIYQRAVTDTQKRVGVEVTQSIPNMVSMVSNLKKATDDFYDANKDLEPFKKVVAHVFDDLIVANPDKAYAEVMSDVAQETRKRLKLPKPTNKTVDKGTPPKLPSKKKKPGRSDHKPKSSPLESGIDEMNKSLNRR